MEIALLQTLEKLAREKSVKFQTKSAPGYSMRALFLLFSLLFLSWSNLSGLWLQTSAQGTNRPLELNPMTSGLNSSESSPEAIRNKLRLLDGRVEDGPFRAGTATLDIRAKDIYKRYLVKASTLTSKLLKIKATADIRKEKYTLQRLAAMTQSLSIENSVFKDSFENGEDQFQSYLLIQNAIANMEDAVAYWREANQTRMLYRGTALDKAEDDEVLKIKLQTAFSAIEELKGLDNVRKVLDKNLTEDQ